MEDGEEDWSKAWWFRLELEEEDVKDWLWIAGDWGHDIVLWEALAQLVLFVLRTRGGCCTGGKVVQSCDNETTVLAHGKGMSTADPLCFILQALGRWKHWRNVEASDHTLTQYYRDHASMPVPGRNSACAGKRKRLGRQDL